jgi:REP element-mobilizing transposase RayT
MDQLKWLKDKCKIMVYRYAIMPNHLHIIWEMLEKNGKEMAHASFNKWTSSNFLKDLRANHPKVVSAFIEKTSERSHRFWQRDPLAILMDSRKKVEQKLNYIHVNPLQEKWSLAKLPEDYRWSSAKFYDSGEDEFGVLTHYRERSG